jgi:hypothetical protein
VRRHLARLGRTRADPPLAIDRPIASNDAVNDYPIPEYFKSTSFSASISSTCSSPARRIVSRARNHSSCADRLSTGRKAMRRVSYDRIAASTRPATVFATSSWRAKGSSNSRSKRSAYTRSPCAASRRYRATKVGLASTTNSMGKRASAVADIGEEAGRPGPTDLDGEVLRHGERPPGRCVSRVRRSERSRLQVHDESPDTHAAGRLDGVWR